MGTTQETCAHFPALPGSVIAHGSTAAIIMCNEETFPPPPQKTDHFYCSICSSGSFLKLFYGDIQ